MPYSKPRYISRRYLPPEHSYINIPYPNEIESQQINESKSTGLDSQVDTGESTDNNYAVRSSRNRGSLSNSRSINIPSIIDFIRSRITIEEIILVGLIILLLGEEVRDEFLIIMLIYILIF